MSNRTHNELAARMIAQLVDNAPDELHDRGRSDAANAVMPHLESIKAMMVLAHNEMSVDASGQDLIADRDLTDDEMDDAAFELQDRDSDIACCAHTVDTIFETLYTPFTAAWDQGF